MDAGPNLTSDSEIAPSDSPSGLEPEQPRLGIIHLLVWTACVAVYFSATRAVYPHDLQQPPGFLLYWLGTGVGSGTALGGLLLWAARRYRRLPFPSQPGEWLLVLLGISAATELLFYVTLCFITEGDRPKMWHVGLLLFDAVGCSRFLLLGVLYLAAMARTRIPRWRFCLATLAIATVLSCLPGFRLLSAAVLVAVVLKDLFDGVPYRWTHWLGVAVELWTSAVSAVWLAFWVSFGYFPPM